MPKFIVILFFFFCSLHCFSQNGLSNTTTDKSNFSGKSGKIEKEKIKAVTVRDISGTEIELLLNNNLCEILSIKPSDLLSEKMLKKLKANV
ncbi:hypothetical protein CLU83_1087 [Flavobacterium sp. 1]|uniref:hypothetical protein n=1 Tax=Flavobacterium sp. 1 TaxID=2035200 RepID=UPI000C24BE48|nr:hypothetical protein [Flavobacterium sp. 1]PJJ07876.1 hypothetical protein CLU83_1087 [Flavobacterium sp. 1]